MNGIATLSPGINAMSPQAIANVEALEKNIQNCPQVAISTHHVLHGGMYVRTILIPAGVVLTGALVKVATTLIITGDIEVSRGDSSKRCTGVAILAASANRKQAFVAYEDTTVTMVFPTKAKTIEEAETEFTDDAHKLMSRRYQNIVVITGE